MCFLLDPVVPALANGVDVRCTRSLDAGRVDGDAALLLAIAEANLPRLARLVHMTKKVVRNPTGECGFQEPNLFGRVLRRLHHGQGPMAPMHGGASSVGRPKSLVGIFVASDGFPE